MSKELSKGKVEKRNNKNVIIISSLVIAIILLIVLVNISNSPKAEIEQQIKEAQTNIIKNVSVDDVMLYGVYDGEPLEWQVLDVENDKALLITKYCIAEKPFNNQEDDNTGQKGTLRKWLNNDFMKSFSKAQQSYIKKTRITDGGNELKDRIFLLSVEEVKQYFPDDELRIAKTKYEVRTCWWLREFGYNNNKAAFVTNRGYVGGNVSDASFSAGVRPAFWLKLGS